MNAVKDSSKFTLSPGVKSVLSQVDIAIADSSSLSDLVGRVISATLDKVIKGNKDN